MVQIESGLSERGKSHQSAFQFPPIPPGFDGNSINPQGSRRLLIRMHSNIDRVFKRFAGPTIYPRAAKTLR